MSHRRLPRIFFDRPTLEVAQELLGKRLVYKDFRGIITETEAYIGREDPASHAFRGRTTRTDVMFGPAGYSYIYMIYGMYYCLNFVTEEEGIPGAVLIRGLLIDQPTRIHLNGPGKLCRHLALTKEHNRIDIISSENLYVESTSLQPNFLSTPRIGIKVATDRLWRFVLPKSETEIIKPHHYF